MKKPSTFHASNSLLEALLILSLFGTVLLTSLSGMADLYATFKSQWHNLFESLAMIQPHRTVFPW